MCSSDLDPASVRRGPFNDVPQNLHGLEARLITSPYHRMSEFCGTCHDVSNPLYSKNAKTGEYALNTLGAAHPTQNPMDMYPEQRTYSEWLNSAYVNGVQYADHRFGGLHVRRELLVLGDVARKPVAQRRQRLCIQVPPARAHLGLQLHYSFIEARVRATGDLMMARKIVGHHQSLLGIEMLLGHAREAAQCRIDLRAPVVRDETFELRDRCSQRAVLLIEHRNAELNVFCMMVAHVLRPDFPKVGHRFTPVVAQTFDLDRMRAKKGASCKRI